MIAGVGQFLGFLAANGAVLVLIAIVMRAVARLVRWMRQSPAEDATAQPSLATVERAPRKIAMALPDFSPKLLALLVRDTPRPKSPQERALAAAQADSAVEVSPKHDVPTDNRKGHSLFFLLLPTVAFAMQGQPVHAQQATQTIALPPVHVDAPAPGCVDVEVDGARQPAFECLNQQLKATAQSATPSDPDAQLKSVAGTGAPNQVGTFSYTGESIRMGNTFGKSAFPQRPPAPVYSNRLTAGVK